MNKLIIYIVINIVFNPLVIIGSAIDNISENENNNTISKENDHIVLNTNIQLLTNTMISLQEQINRYNELYINRLDQKLTSLAISVANLDSNVRNIQERAHVWDTFQLHVSAWNEQIKSLDRKTDLISSGQEKLMQLEGKMNTLLIIEYNSQRILNKLLNFEEKLDSIEKLLKNKGEAQPSPIYEEFIMRGVLATLKTLEEKIDNTNLVLHTVANKRKQIEIKQNDSLTLETAKSPKCYISSEIEDLAKDVASKIDLIHDRIVIDNSDENDDEESDMIYKYKKTLNEKLKFILNKLDTQDKTQSTSINDIKQIILNLGNSKHEKCAPNRLEIAGVISTTMYENVNYEYDFLGITTPVYYNSVEVSTIEEDDSSTEIYDNKYIDVTTTNSSFYNDIGEISDESIYIADVSNLSIILSNMLSSNENISNICKNPVAERYCDEGYIILQRRENNKENFNRSWSEYKNGFGNINEGNFWIGNELIHLISSKLNTTLRIELRDFDENTAWAIYNNFEVGSEDSGYSLRISGFIGNASDSLKYHDGCKFSTFDKTNDEAPSCCPCSTSYGGGWWFKSCFASNLNGIYYESPIRKDYRGIIWNTWKKDLTLYKTKMSIKITDDYNI